MAAHAHDHHVHPKSMYVKNLLALFVLMLLTIFAAQVNFADIVQGWGWSGAVGSVINNVIAMTIATIKAVLVVMFFMHVKFGTSLIKLWAITGFVWVTLMSLILLDYGTRKYEPVNSWNADSGSALPRAIERRELPTNEMGAPTERH